MRCDMVVALGRAAADGHARFGQNISRPAGPWLALHRSPGRAFAPGEAVQTQRLPVPQVRQTHTVVGCRPARCWGYYHGLNEHGVAAGCAGFHTKLRSEQPGLAATDLVRLVLERSQSARQAVDVLAGLLERHGQGVTGSPGDGHADHAVLIADAAEAFVVETAANHWVCQEILQARAVGNLCTVRQDWDRISRGLGGYAIERGWWPADGSKLDFAEALCDNPVGEASALRRWGRATLLLEQQNGHIDAGFLRRLLGDHYEGTAFEIDPFAGRQVPLPLCQHATEGEPGTAVSFLAELAPAAASLQVLGCAFGPPCLSVYLPVFLDGELPPALTAGGPDADVPALGWQLGVLADQLRSDAGRVAGWREQLGRLQADLDQQAEEFAAEGAAMKRQGDHARLRQSATEQMQRGLGLLDAALTELVTHPPSPPRLHAVGAAR